MLNLKAVVGVFGVFSGLRFAWNFRGFQADFGCGIQTERESILQKFRAGDTSSPGKLCEIFRRWNGPKGMDNKRIEMTTPGYPGNLALIYVLHHTILNT